MSMFFSLKYSLYTEQFMFQDRRFSLQLQCHRFKISHTFFLKYKRIQNILLREVEGNKFCKCNANFCHEVCSLDEVRLILGNFSFQNYVQSTLKKTNR
jgi:hypothetical protein